MQQCWAIGLYYFSSLILYIKMQFKEPLGRANIIFCGTSLLLKLQIVMEKGKTIKFKLKLLLLQKSDCCFFFSTKTPFQKYSSTFEITTTKILKSIQYLAETFRIILTYYSLNFFHLFVSLYSKKNTVVISVYGFSTVTRKS